MRYLSLHACDLVHQVFAPLQRGLAAEAAPQEFLVVPGKGTPRWLLPAQHHRIDQVLASWSPYRPTSRLKWAAIRAAHRAGCLSVLPDVGRVNTPFADDIDWHSVGWRGNSTPVPVVYVGTPAVSRKAVIHLVNPESGICQAIVKVPLTEAARAAILWEADVLEILADEGFTGAPRLLYTDRDGGVTTQTMLNGKAGSRKFDAAYSELLRSLVLDGERTTIAGHALEWREKLLRNVESEIDPRIMTAVWSELRDLDPIPACWIHGDFAPWNIRRLPDGTVVLLDWECAQRGGLPLQDAFHFLHIQDYLFGARPSAHSHVVLACAESIGISSGQCRKLEIAYLTQSYLRRLARGEVEHAEYLLHTLQAALHGRQRLCAPVIDFPVEGPPELAPAATFSSCPQLREDLFAAVVEQLNTAEIPYCVLSGHEKQAGNSLSDVDFMFHPRDMGRLAPLLAQAAQRAGGRLIQAMPHETTACYFVIAKDGGSEIGYFDPDCATDYRGQGRLWLSAAAILARHRRCKDFYVPAAPDEFAYYLIKKVLKQSLDDFQLRRLRHLYQRAPVTCCAEALRFWPLATVRRLERALVASDLAWFESHMPGLLAELHASEPVESLGKRVVQKIQSAARVVGRILRPTGMSVLVCGGANEQRSAIATGLVQQLAPAFRRTATVHLDPTGAMGPRPGFRLTGKIMVARLRSTFVVSAIEGKLAASSLSLLLARLLFQPDLIFVVTADDGPMSSSSRLGSSGDFHFAARRGQVVYLNAGLSEEENVLQASRTVLQWLATRQEGRLSRKQGHFAASNVSQPAENLPQAVGLHLVVK